MSRSDYLVARDAALLRLKGNHPTEFALLYDEERGKVGLPPLLDRKRERITSLQATLDRLKKEVGE